MKNLLVNPFDFLNATGYSIQAPPANKVTPQKASSDITHGTTVLDNSSRGTGDGSGDTIKSLTDKYNAEKKAGTAEDDSKKDASDNSGTEILGHKFSTTQIIIAGVIAVVVVGGTIYYFKHHHNLIKK